MLVLWHVKLCVYSLKLLVVFSLLCGYLFTINYVCSICLSINKSCLLIKLVNANWLVCRFKAWYPYVYHESNIIPVKHNCKLHLHDSLGFLSRRHPLYPCYSTRVSMNIALQLFFRIFRKTSLNEYKYGLYVWYKFISNGNSFAHVPK